MRAARVLDTRLVAVLWAALPFGALWWLLTNARWTGSAKEAVTAAVLFAIVAGVVISAAVGLWRGVLWAQALIGTFAGALILYSACVGLWLASELGSQILMIALVGAAIGLYSILSLARARRD